MKKLHLISLAHTSTTAGYEQCAFTARNTKFPAMMKPYGYETLLYGSDQNEADADLITCITKAQQDYFLSEYDWYQKGLYYKIPFDESLPIWRFFIKNVIKQLKNHYSVGDLILISSPIFYKPIHREFPKAIIIEYGVGYPTILAPYRVFESEAWRNYVYGSNNISDFEYMNDVVIPNYYDPKKFPLVTKKEDYLLFMGRPIPSKGWAWVQILASQGHKVKVAGAQKVEGKNIEWVGYVEGDKKAELLGKAKALLSPTIYLEPFGGVVAEAALCGTAAITTNHGCYKETVRQGVTGFRCKNLTEMSEALEKISTLSPQVIHNRAVSLWSTDVVGKQYHNYFQRF